MKLTLQNLMNLDAKSELARRHHLNFIQQTWRKSEPFIIGYHTEKICEKIDHAIDRYKKGINQFVIVQVPPRHGKSDIISRYLPPHFLGMFPESEVLITTYAGDLSNKLSRFSRNIIKSREYQKIYPDIRLSKDSQAVQEWELSNGKGTTQWVGIGGGITGRGYHLGIIDDFLKNRQDAESEVIRDKGWEWFTNVFLTRRAPVSITFILCTPWHVDDLIGRIKKEMQRNTEFPNFEIITFPAKSDEYENGYLFLERFPKEWYRGQEAALGSYGTAALLQCNPIIRGGNFFKTDGIKIIEEKDLPDDLRFVRGWDLASSKKERLKSDPDYTVGVLCAVKWILKKEINQKMPIIYIKDIVRIRSEAPERNNKIIQTTKIDGASVKVSIEVVAGYKDTYTIMKDILMGICLVRPIHVSADKVSRASVLEPIFEAGNVYLVKGDWNRIFIKEAETFPSGKHDDQIDGLLASFLTQKSGPVTSETISTENPEIKENRAMKGKVEIRQDRGSFNNNRKNLI